MANRSRTLAVLTPAFPANESETDWVTTQQLFVRTLKEQFPDLQIIILSFYYPEHVCGYEWNGLPVFPFNGSRRRRKLKRIFFWREVWRRLREIHRQHELVGLFSFWLGECALLGSAFGRRYSLPHFCWLCGQDARPGNKMVRLIRPKAEELIGMSDFLMDEFQQNYGIRPRHRIINAIHPAQFPTASGVKDIDIMGAGSLSRLKQYDQLVGVVAALRTPFPAIRATLCGDGEHRETIETLIKELGLESHLSLTGRTPHEDVLRYMQRTRVFLHTSNYEGFGIVCLEALYAGAQVISYCRPLAEDIPGWHIVKDAGEMIEKATVILNEPPAAPRRVLPYTMADAVKAVMKLFQYDSIGIEP